MATKGLSEKEAALLAEARRQAAALAAQRPASAAAAPPAKAAPAPGTAALAAKPPATATAPAPQEQPAVAPGPAQPPSPDLYARMAIMMESERRNTESRKARMRMTGTVIVALFTVPLIAWMFVLILKHLIR